MKKTISILVTVLMLLSLITPAYANANLKYDDPAWDSSYNDTGTIAPQSASERTNASGEKIASNAHSGDIPGIYFYWNDKQKDDGVLLVTDEFFSKFKDGNSFYVTAKNANAYWDYAIVKGAGEYVSDGVTAYKIPRYFMYLDKKGKQVKDELKNINMLFIGGDIKDTPIQPPIPTTM